MKVLARDCPCSGKGMSNLAGPWILLLLYSNGRMHGYEIGKYLETQVSRLGLSVNITGVYRHLKQLEERGMLVSEWDMPTRGPARRAYGLTEAGTQCLNRWIETLSVQKALIGRFLEQARQSFTPHADAGGKRSQEHHADERNLTSSHR